MLPLLRDFPSAPLRQPGVASSLRRGTEFQAARYNRSMRTIRCAAILFDLDGVLVESRPAVERQWTVWARRHGLDPATVIHLAHGRPTIDTIRMLAPHLNDIEELARVEQAEINDLDGVRAIPGAAKLLTSLPPERWTIVTSGTLPLAITRLRHVGLPVPPQMVTASDIAHGKPHPEPYRLGAKRLGFAPRDCLVIEDSPSGVQSAHAAGARAVAVPTTYPASELRAADALVKRLSDLRVHTAGQGGDIRIEITWGEDR